MPKKSRYRKPNKIIRDFRESIHKVWDTGNLTREHLKGRIEQIRNRNPKAVSIGITIKYINPQGVSEKARVTDKNRGASLEFIMKDVDQLILQGTKGKTIEPTGYIITLKYNK